MLLGCCASRLAVTMLRAETMINMTFRFIVFPSCGYAFIYQTMGRPLIEDCGILCVPCSLTACETNTHKLKKAYMFPETECSSPRDLLLIHKGRVALEVESIVSR